MKWLTIQRLGLVLGAIAFGVGVWVAFFDNAASVLLIAGGLLFVVCLLSGRDELEAEYKDMKVTVRNVKKSVETIVDAEVSPEDKREAEERLQAGLEELEVHLERLRVAGSEGTSAFNLTLRPRTASAGYTRALREFMESRDEEHGMFIGDRRFRDFLEEGKTEVELSLVAAVRPTIPVVQIECLIAVGDRRFEASQPGPLPEGPVRFFWPSSFTNAHGLSADIALSNSVDFVVHFADRKYEGVWLPPSRARSD